MSTYSAFATDSGLEVSGITLDLGSTGKFVIARAGGANKNFAKKFAAATKPYRRAIQTGTLDEEISMKLLVETYVDSVLLGWSGVTDENGNELKFNRANAIKLMTDLPALFEEIRRHAEDYTIFRKAVRLEDAGN